MMNWLQNPDADFVIAAYAIAAIILLTLLIASLWAYKCHSAEWKALSSDSADSGRADANSEDGAQ